MLALSAEHPAEQRPEPDIWLLGALVLFQGGLQKAWPGTWHPGGPGRGALTPGGISGKWEPLVTRAQDSDCSQIIAPRSPPQLVPFLVKWEGQF